MGENNPWKKKLQDEGKICDPVKSFADLMREEELKKAVLEDDVSSIFKFSEGASDEEIAQIISDAQQLLVGSTTFPNISDQNVQESTDLIENKQPEDISVPDIPPDEEQDFLLAQYLQQLEDESLSSAIASAERVAAAEAAAERQTPNSSCANFGDTARFSKIQVRSPSIQGQAVATDDCFGEYMSAEDRLAMINLLLAGGGVVDLPAPNAATATTTAPSMMSVYNPDGGLIRNPASRKAVSSGWNEATKLANKLGEENNAKLFQMYKHDERLQSLVNAQKLSELEGVGDLQSSGIMVKNTVANSIKSYSAKKRKEDREVQRKKTVSS